jgi:uncharacterized protein YqeY
MSLRERLQQELTAARRSGDVLRRDALGMVHSSLAYAEKEKRSPLDADEVEAVLAREVKMRRESVEAFRKGGREDLASKEATELQILSEFMPQLSEDQIRALIGDAIRETGASSPRDMRVVMDHIRSRTSGRADGKVVAGLVAQALAQADPAMRDMHR